MENSVRQMATLHAICGLPGSGKSTLAEKLARDLRCVSLSADEWAIQIFGNFYNEPGHLAIEKLHWELGKKLLAAGLDVVLDNGFWTKERRSWHRSEVEMIGARWHLHYLDVPVAQLKDRLATRNQPLPSNSFHITGSDLDACVAIFEPPDSAELR